MLCPYWGSGSVIDQAEVVRSMGLLGLVRVTGFVYIVDTLVGDTSAWDTVAGYMQILPNQNSERGVYEVVVCLELDWTSIVRQ